MIVIFSQEEKVGMSMVLSHVSLNDVHFHLIIIEFD